MSRRVRIARWTCRGAGVLAALAFLFSLFVPFLLAPYRLQVRRVRSLFRTPAEKALLTGQAQLLETPAFEMLYAEAGWEPVWAYLPPRGSWTHALLARCARGLSVERPAAAREDVFTASVPGRPKCVDVRKAYPVQERTVRFFLGWFRFGAGLALAMFLLAAFLLGRRLRQAER